MEQKQCCQFAIIIILLRFLRLIYTPETLKAQKKKLAVDRKLALRLFWIVSFKTSKSPPTYRKVIKLNAGNIYEGKLTDCEWKRNI